MKIIPVTITKKIDGNYLAEITCFPEPIRAVGSKEQIKEIIDTAFIWYIAHPSKDFDIMDIDYVGYKFQYIYKREYTVSRMIIDILRLLMSTLMFVFAFTVMLIVDLIVDVLLITFNLSMLIYFFLKFCYTSKFESCQFCLWQETDVDENLNFRPTQLINFCKTFWENYKFKSLVDKK